MHVCAWWALYTADPPPCLLLDVEQEEITEGGAVAAIVELPSVQNQVVFSGVGDETGIHSW